MAPVCGAAVTGSRASGSPRGPFEEPAVPADALHQDDPHALLQHARAELRRRLLAGEPCRAETFFNAHPTLASDFSLALELISEEVKVRRQLGQDPSRAELIERFPQWQDWLAVLNLRAPTESAGVTPLGDTVPQAPSGPGGPVALDVPELGRHDCYEEVGRGGMGVVYRARDLVLGRDVALKIIRPDLIEGSDAVQRFYREAQAAAALRHPNIVPIHGMGLHEGRHCFTMPLLSGGNLAHHKDRFQHDVRAAVTLMEKVAQAVEAAHERGIVHRDLKPANILLDETGQPVVTDFGLAKVPGASAETTHPGQRLGTPAYMAPEQAAGHSWRVTPASDVWALGVILYEVLTGQRPFRGEDTEAVLQQVLTAEPPPARQARPDLDAALEAVLSRCLQKEPTSRYTSAGGLADDLRRWLDGEPLARHEPDILPETAVTEPPRRRSRAWLLASAGAIAVGAALYIRAGDPDSPRRKVESRLQGGEAVMLIGATGRPPWFQTLLGEGELKPLDIPDTTFTLAAHAPSLVALVRDPGRAYSLTAEVCHRESSRLGAVGVFLGYSNTHTDQGTNECFLALTFNDLESLYRNGPHGADTRRWALTQYRWVGEADRREHDLLSGYFPKGQAGPNNAAPWHRLEVELRSESITVLWEGKPAGTLTRDEVAKSFWSLRQTRRNAAMVDDCPNFVPEFGPRQPLGFFVQHGQASFRNVVVRPLP
jgi:hypothetical protein